MSDAEKLKIACDNLKQAIKNGKTEKSISEKWLEMALRGSVQSRNARAKKQYLFYR